LWTDELGGGALLFLMRCATGLGFGSETPLPSQRVFACEGIRLPVSEPWLRMAAREIAK
jgi:hypothetical protein